MLPFNSYQWAGVLLCVGGLYFTLFAYDFIHANLLAGTTRVKNKLRWLGPLTFIIGLADIFLKGSS